ncbi:Protein-methionine-sulfoxide reductase catalytic subunit MsrP [subsurface metagenome]
MKKLIISTIILYVVISVTVIAISGCGGGRNMDETEELEPTEIREYEGEKLSSVDDFRENSIKGPQQVDIESYQLKVNGLVENPKNYTYGELIDSYQHYKKLVTLDCVEGWSVDILWEGVLIRELIAASSPLPSTKVVIFHAYDGYTTSFPLDYIMNNDIIIAYRMNEIDLPPERGYPFQLVAESKWGYKWIKWITEIELSDDVDYKGYWESRGYSDTGDLDKDFFE